MPFSQLSRTWFSFPNIRVSCCLTYPKESCLVSTCCSRRTWSSSGLVCHSHAAVWDISVSQMALVFVFKQPNLAPFISAIEKLCLSSVYRKLFTQAPEVSMINGDRMYCGTLKGAHVLGLPGLISSHRSENYAQHIEYYPRSQKSKQNQNSDVLTSKPPLKYAALFDMDQMHYSLKIYVEKVSIDFSYSFDSVWSIPSSINTRVVPSNSHEAAWEIFHAVWWLLSFCCLPLVLEISIRDLLLQELRALFLVIELRHDNLPPWAIIKTDLIVLPKWHLNMMQLPESYCYNYLLIARKKFPIILLPFLFLGWKSTSLKTKQDKNKTKKTPKQTTKSTAKKRKASENFFFFLNWVTVSFKTPFFAFLKQSFWMHCIDIVVKFSSFNQIQLQIINEKKSPLVSKSLWERAFPNEYEKHDD